MSKKFDIVQDEAHFLAVNCQTNSNNFDQYKQKIPQIGLFSLDQSEMSLAREKQFDECDELENLRNLLVPHMVGLHAVVQRP